jgi:hypothetical protein
MRATAQRGLLRHSLNHSLPLCALGTPLVAAARARDQTLAATAAAAYSTFLVHAALDWGWEMPVTTLAGLVCGAALLVSPRADV